MQDISSSTKAAMLSLALTAMPAMADITVFDATPVPNKPSITGGVFTQKFFVSKGYNGTSKIQWSSNLTSWTDAATITQTYNPNTDQGSLTVTNVNPAITATTETGAQQNISLKWFKVNGTWQTPPSPITVLTEGKNVAISFAIAGKPSTFIRVVPQNIADSTIVTSDYSKPSS